MTLITPTRHNDDAMPVEVATAILSEPKARTTNTFRKTAKLAREKVFQSDVPMRSFETYPGKLFSTGAPAKPTPPAVKLHSRSLTQVLKWLRRSIARRWVIQDAAIKMDKVNTNRFTPTQLREHAFRLLVLEQQARALDNARDTLEDEITRRKCRASMSFGLHKNGLHHIDPAVRRRAALLRAVGSAQ